MNGDEFLKSFFTIVHKEGVPATAKRSREWTEVMAARLHAVCRSADLGCCCRTGEHKGGPGWAVANKSDGLHREYMIDFAWFRSWEECEQPVVLIEHENSWNDRAFLLDFWKLMFTYAPLRVMFGYASSSTGVEQRIRLANETAAKQAWRFPSGVEDVVLLGHRDMDRDRFVVLRRHPGEKAFARAGMLADVVARGRRLSRATAGA